MPSVIRIDTVRLLEQAFGLAGISIYQVRAFSHKLEPNTDKIKETPVIIDDDVDGTGLLGLPVIGNVVFPSPKDDSYDGIVLLSPLTTVSLSKNIVKTPVAGRDGTVKEYIGANDYDVTIQGLLVNPDPNQQNKRPEKQIRLLKKLIDLKIAIPVESKFLQWFGIHNLVIENSDFPPLMGVVNVQPFSLKCVSDDPLEIETLKNL